MTLPPTRSECAEIVGRLWPHLDGALPESERERVIAHLEGCTACRSHYDFASAFLRAVHRAKPDDTEFTAIRERVGRALAGATR